MKSYLDIMNAVIERGVTKQPYRNGKPVGDATIGLPNVVFSHDMSTGFPLLTTKKMAINSIMVELEGFLKGKTSKKWFQERDCRIWNEWCGHAEHTGDEARKCDWLGPIYGYQWAKDQLDEVLNKLKTVEGQYDRRLVVSAWHFADIPKMALPPCHMIWNVSVFGEHLNLAWMQRPCDLALGVPFNIASYATLLLLLARHAGLKPGNLTGLLVDCHLYKRQIPGAIDQLARSPKALPMMEVHCDDVANWTHKDWTLMGYEYDERPLSFGDVVV